MTPKQLLRLANTLEDCGKLIKHVRSQDMSLLQKKETRKEIEYWMNVLAEEHAKETGAIPPSPSSVPSSASSVEQSFPLRGIHNGVPCIIWEVSYIPEQGVLYAIIYSLPQRRFRMVNITSVSESLELV